MKKTIYYSLPLLLTFIFFGCKKSNNESDQIHRSSNLVIKDGLVHIQDFSQLDSFRSSDEKVKASTTLAGFLSMQDCYDLILDDELRVATEENKDVRSKIKIPASQVKHTSLLQNYPDIVQAKYRRDGFGYFEVNVRDCDLSLMPFLNKDRMIVVGDNLYQFGRDTVKFIPYVGKKSIIELINPNNRNSVIVYSSSSNISGINTQSSDRGFVLEKDVANGGKHTIIRVSMDTTMLHSFYVNNFNQLNFKYVYTEPLNLSLRSLQERTLGLWLDNYSTTFTNINIEVRYVPKNYSGTIVYNPHIVGSFPLSVYDVIDNVSLDMPSNGRLIHTPGQLGPYYYRDCTGSEFKFPIFSYIKHTLVPSRDLNGNPITVDQGQLMQYNSTMRYGLSEPILIDYIKASTTANGVTASVEQAF